MDNELQQRSNNRLASDLKENAQHFDRMFAYLLGIEWMAAILVASFISPFAWEGKTRVVNMHVWLALLLGGALVSLPSILVRLQPGHILNRHVIAVAQMGLGALLIHLTGGRLETHFHIFGSLAFLSVYRDWRVLVTASVTVLIDHYLRGVFWPESIFGITNPEWWRFLEHGMWVMFCDIFLIHMCLKSMEQSRIVAQRQAEAEIMAEQQTELVFELQMKLAESELARGTPPI